MSCVSNGCTPSTRAEVTPISANARATCSPRNPSRPRASRSVRSVECRCSSSRICNSRSHVRTWAMKRPRTAELQRADAVAQQADPGRQHRCVGAPRVPAFGIGAAEAVRGSEFPRVSCSCSFRRTESLVRGEVLEQELTRPPVTLHDERLEPVFEAHPRAAADTLEIAAFELQVDQDDGLEALHAVLVRGVARIGSAAAIAERRARQSRVAAGMSRASAARNVTPGASASHTTACRARLRTRSASSSATAARTRRLPLAST